MSDALNYLRSLCLKCAAASKFDPDFHDPRTPEEIGITAAAYPLTGLPAKIGPQQAAQELLMTKHTPVEGEVWRAAWMAAWRKRAEKRAGLTEALKYQQAIPPATTAGQLGQSFLQQAGKLASPFTAVR